MDPDDGVRCLADQLALAATHHSRAALRLFGLVQLSDFYLHAGVAIELAIKARLARHNAAWLAPRSSDWFRHAVLLSKGAELGFDGPSVVTVTAADALDRLRELEPGLPDVFREQVRETLALRNHVAHVGMRTFPPDGQQRVHAAAFVRAVNRLLLVPADEFWDDLAHLAAELVRDDLDGAAVRVEQLRIGARARVSSIGESLLQQLIQASVAESAALIGPDVVAVDCPVCGAVATVEGELVDEGEPDYETEDGVAVPYWAYELNVIVDRFVCRVCGFSLTGEDELKAAGVPVRVANPEASPGDLYEPDLDRD